MITAYAPFSAASSRRSVSSSSSSAVCVGLTPDSLSEISASTTRWARFSFFWAAASSFFFWAVEFSTFWWASSFSCFCFTVGTTIRDLVRVEGGFGTLGFGTWWAPPPFLAALVLVLPAAADIVSDMMNVVVWEVNGTGEREWVNIRQQAPWFIPKSLCVFATLFQPQTLLTSQLRYIQSKRKSPLTFMRIIKKPATALNKALDALERSQMDNAPLPVAKRCRLDKVLCSCGCGHYVCKRTQSAHIKKGGTFTARLARAATSISATSVPPKTAASTSMSSKSAHSDEGDKGGDENDTRHDDWGLQNDQQIMEDVPQHVYAEFQGEFFDMWSFYNQILSEPNRCHILHLHGGMFSLKHLNEVRSLIWLLRIELLWRRMGEHRLFLRRLIKPRLSPLWYEDRRYWRQWQPLRVYVGWFCSHGRYLTCKWIRNGRWRI